MGAAQIYLDGHLLATAQVTNESARGRARKRGRGRDREGERARASALDDEGVTGKVVMAGQHRHSTSLCCQASTGTAAEATS